MDDLLAVADVAPKKVNSHDIKLGIRNSFASGYQVFFEVGNDTGTKVTRHADAVSIGIWPSTGHRIHGYEVKVSRADFVNEMKDGAKAQAVFQYCHHWSLATPPGLIKVDELPPNWGLVTFDGKTLRTVKMAPRLSPVPLSAGFVAALVRRAGDIDAGLIAAAQNKTRLEMEARIEERVERAVRQHRSNATSSAEEAIKIVAALKQQLGEHWLQEYHVPEIAEAVRIVRRMRLSGNHNSIAALVKTLTDSAERIREGLTELDAGEAASLTHHHTV